MDELAASARRRRRTATHFDLDDARFVNGEEVSRGNVKDMTWTFAQILERASYGVTLYPGDVIGSGTCGTGCFLELNGSKITNDQWLKAGRRRRARNRPPRDAREPRGTVAPPMPTLRRYTVVPRLPAAARAPARDRPQPLVVVGPGRARALRAHRRAISGRRCTATRSSSSSRVEQTRLDELATDDAFLSHLEAAWQHASSATCRARAGSRRRFPERGGRAHRLLLDGVRPPRVPADLLGRPRRARRRSPEDRERSRPAARRRRPRVRRGLLPPGAQRRRLAGRALPDQRLAPPAGLAGARRARASASSSTCTYPDRVVHAQLWRVQVGRVPLFLLDANLERERAGRSHDHRPALRRRPGVPHPPGDHARHRRRARARGDGPVADRLPHERGALGVPRARAHRARHARSRRDASRSRARPARRGNIFTTHTPVPAGNDAFVAELVRRYLEPYRAALGITEDELLGARARRARRDQTRAVLDAGPRDPHGRSLQRRERAPRRGSRDDVAASSGRTCPSTRSRSESITNGVHTAVVGLATRWARSSRATSARAGPSRRDDPTLWARVHEIPDAELWQVARAPAPSPRARSARRWLRAAAERRGEPARGDRSVPTRCSIRARSPSASRDASRRTSARRCSSRDLERVKRLLGDPRPPGAARLRRQGAPAGQGRQGAHSHRSSTRAATRVCAGKVVFVEDYDMRIARALVSGVDVWLNTPRRPLEASGTSGMKAAANGALNVSVLDGWWAEAWRRPRLARSAGRSAAARSTRTTTGDRVEAELLYDVLEREVVPLFFDREGRRDALPRALDQADEERDRASSCPSSTRRAWCASTPSASTSRRIKLWHRMVDGDLARRARAHGVEGARARRRGPRCAIARGLAEVAPTSVRVGEPMRVSATVQLGDLLARGRRRRALLRPDRAAATSSTRGAGRPHEGRGAGRLDGRYRYAGEIPTRESGAHAFAVARDAVQRGDEPPVRDVARSLGLSNELD